MFRHLSKRFWPVLLDIILTSLAKVKTEDETGRNFSQGRAHGRRIFGRQPTPGPQGFGQQGVGSPNQQENPPYANVTPPPYGQSGQGYQQGTLGPPNQGYQQGYYPQDYPQQGYPHQGYPPHGYPPQGQPPHGYPPQGYPPQGYPPQGHPPHGFPPQGPSPVNQMGLAACFGSCAACLTCILCSCCNAALALVGNHPDEDGVGGDAIGGVGGGGIGGGSVGGGGIGGEETDSPGSASVSPPSFSSEHKDD